MHACLAHTRACSDGIRFYVRHIGTLLQDHTRWLEQSSTHYVRSSTVAPMPQIGKIRKIIVVIKGSVPGRTRTRWVAGERADAELNKRIAQRTGSTRCFQLSLQLTLLF